MRDGSVVLPGSRRCSHPHQDGLLARDGAAELAAKVGDPTVSEKLIAMTVDCNGGYVYLDPYEGAKIAVTEACRNLACSGALPLGATDNLNMPSPLKPELFWQIKESVRGLAEGCKAFNAPVTGGNCSLYNQSPAGPIDPTPTSSAVGLIEKLEHVTTQWFKDEGDAIILLGETVDQADPIFGLGGSAYLQVIHGQKNRFAAALRSRSGEDAAHHAHRPDPIRPGEERARLQRRRLAVALARKLHQPAHRPRHAAPHRCNRRPERDQRRSASMRCSSAKRNHASSISCKPLDAVKVVERAKLMGVPAVQIGKVGGDKLTVKPQVENSPPRSPSCMTNGGTASPERWRKTQGQGRLFSDFNDSIVFSFRPESGDMVFRIPRMSSSCLSCRTRFTESMK
ncbi:MAG: AIR synthase related protein [Limisphaerales bacterium]